jgi:MFS family permease
MVAAFAVTMFVSAALLFLMEPMFAKMVLPLLGGTAAVLNTCLVFFQAVLLAAYAYAHASVKLLSRRGQTGLHLAVLLAALLVLPLRVPDGWVSPVQHNPVGWLLLLLVVAVGAPFFAISASTPILQQWFSHSGHPSAADPYFLYAASNSGSILGLLTYPLLLEPVLRLTEQSRLWAWCYGLFLLLVAACAVLVWRAPDTAPSSASQPAPGGLVQDSLDEKPEVLNARRRFRWVALAFVPSTLMLGVTSALTTDIPAIPLLWVLPLALYLLSFVLVFARRPILSHQWLIRRLPFLILAASVPVVSKAVYPLFVLIPLDLLTLFAVAMVCHGELARSRPSARCLTEFYLWVSAGGVLGGIFNALIAPLVFSSLVEFPLALVLAAAVRPPIDVVKDTSRARKLDYLLPIALGVCVAAVPGPSAGSRQPGPRRRAGVSGERRYEGGRERHEERQVPIAMGGDGPRAGRPRRVGS